MMVLMVGLLQVAAYSISGMLASTDGSMPTPQPDTLLYCQAARRIAEGHPFSYSAGEKCSTGTTSVLYPFVLSVPYVAGCKEARLLTAGFWLNSAFYLIFLACWALTFCRWIKDRSTLLFAILALSLAAQPAICAFAQSDSGFIMAVSSVFFLGLAYRRTWVWGSALVVLPWVRPEGMMCVLSVCVVLAVEKMLSGRRLCAAPRWREGLVAGLSLLSAIGVFGFNYALTGAMQFSSVANKGYFQHFPFSSAVVRIFGSFSGLVRTYLCGIGDMGFSVWFAVPLAVGLAVVWGIITIFQRREDFPLRDLGIFGMATTLSFASVASSGFAGSNFDRYLAWCQPLLIFLTAVGTVDLCVHLRRSARAVVWLGYLGYLAAGCVAAVCAYHASSRVSDWYLQFSKKADELMPAGASVGGAHCNIAYLMGERRFFHLSGLYSPDFFCRGRIDAADVIERLRHRPELRPDYLVLDKPDYFFNFEKEGLDKLGEQILVGPIGLDLRKFNRSIFDNSLAADLQPTGRTLVASVDVGYSHDEQAAEFRIVDRWGRQSGAPFVRLGKLNGRDIIDTGRVVVGYSEMSVPLACGKDTAVVIRAAKTAKANFNVGASSESPELAFNVRKVTLDVYVDGKLSVPVRLDLSGQVDAKDDFVEFAFTVPGRAITRSTSRVAIGGDHIPCCYWFYQ